jgi:hypothetical protein
MKAVAIAIVVFGLLATALSQYVVSQPGSVASTIAGTGGGGASAGVNVGGVGAQAQIGSASGIAASATTMLVGLLASVLLRK